MWQVLQKVEQSEWFDSSQQAAVFLISETDSSLILHHFAKLAASNWMCHPDEIINDVIIYVKIPSVWYTPWVWVIKGMQYYLNQLINPVCEVCFRCIKFNAQKTKCNIYNEKSWLI